jgi:hypothetical protein
MTNKVLFAFASLAIAVSVSGFTNNGIYSKYQGTTISKADGGGHAIDKKKKKKKHKKSKKAYDDDDENNDDGQVA